MWTPPVVVIHPVVTDILLRFPQAHVSRCREPLSLQTPEQPLHRGVSQQLPRRLMLWSCYSATAAAETHGCHIGCPERSETARLIGNLVADRAYRALLLPALHQVCQTSPSPWLAGYEGRVPRRFRLHQYAHGLRRRRPFCRVNEEGGDSPGIGPEPHRKS